MSKQGEIRAGRNGGNPVAGSLLRGPFQTYFHPNFERDYSTLQVERKHAYLIENKENLTRLLDTTLHTRCRAFLRPPSPGKALSRNMVESFVSKLCEGLV